MKTKNLFVLLALLPLTAFAGEMAKGSNYLVLDNQSWPTDEASGFYIFSGTGIANVIEGPTETGSIECHDSGLWSKNGSRAEGICLHGSGEDTFTSHYKMDEDQTTGHWKMLSGTGKNAGITGEGIYTPTMLPGGRAISNWEGEVTLAE